MPYFDWNATAPLLPAAREAWLEAGERYWANPSTPYRLGVQARLALDEARETVAALTGVETGQVVFTSGATEGNNALIREAARAAGPDRVVWISAVEHPSVRDAARACWGNERVRVMPVTAEGVVDLDWMRERIASERPAVVFVMAVNNETGVIQPMDDILDQCQAAGAACFCDAVQWLGKHLGPADLCRRCSALVASGHKIGGPKGTGLLILGSAWSGLKVQHGGAQELNSRAGTENLPGILAMVAALKARCSEAQADDHRQLRDAFEERLLALWPGEVTFHGRGAPRSWNTSMVSLPQHRAGRWISRLDRAGVQVSSGSACSSGKAGISQVLAAMEVETETGRRAVRISGGWDTCREDWERLLEALLESRAALDREGPSGGLGQLIQP